ncbi:hypothetical protein K1719_018424 [Acacia pycnantha]|nr:hypothetical protein K1719_018424 [Acacia pycnantha]
MVGLNKLGTAITVIISLTLAALFLEILYLLWRRHSLRRRTHSDPETDKQLLHFLCWKRKSRVEPQRTSPPTSSSSPPKLLIWVSHTAWNPNKSPHPLHRHQIWFISQGPLEDHWISLNSAATMSCAMSLLVCLALKVSWRIL